MSVIKPTPTRLRFRRSGAVWLASILVLIFVIPFAGSVFVELEGLTRILLTPLAAAGIVIPLCIAVWSLRSGVDVAPEGLTVKALLASRHYSWSAIRGFDAQGTTVYALLESHNRLPLPAVQLADLPKLIAAGGEEISDDNTDQ